MTSLPRPGPPYLSLGAAAALSWAALAAGAATPAAAQVPSGVSHSPLAGSRVYGGARCSACHSVRGYGGGDAPDLADVSGPRSFWELAAAMWNHLPRDLEAMREADAASTRLDGREAGDLVAFLFSLGYFTPAGDPEAGRQLFREKGCIECHQIGGAGGVVGPNLDFLRFLASPIEVAAAMWNHGPRMQEELEERDIPRPSFDASEFVDLLAYLQADTPGVPARSLHVLPGRADRGQELFRGKNCIRCHGPPGAGGRAGPDLASRTRGRSLLEFAAAMWNHQPQMLEEATSREISLPRLEPGEMSDVVAYLYSVRYLPGAGDRRVGAGLVRRKGCLQCHTPGASPDQGAGDLSRVRGVTSAADVIASMWNHLPLAAERGLPASQWTDFTEEEMADLAAYLESAARRTPPPGDEPR